MISPANTYPGLTKAGKGEANEPDVYYPDGCARNYSRVVPADDLQGRAGALWASQLGVTKAYVLDDTQLYGKGIADVFANEAPGFGVEVLGRDGIDGKATDYKALAEKIKAAAPELVYYGGITQNNAGQLWRDLRDALGPDVKLMGPDGIFEGEWLEAAGEAAEGSYITFGGVPPDQLDRQGRRVRRRPTRRSTRMRPPRPTRPMATRPPTSCLPRSSAPRRRNPADNNALRAAIITRGHRDQGLRRCPGQLELQRRGRHEPDRDVGQHRHRWRVHLRQGHQGRVVTRPIRVVLITAGRLVIQATGRALPTSIRRAEERALEALLTALVIGLANGLIIALIAIGYTLVYGILELINFAHGDVFMLGTAFTFFATTFIVDEHGPGPGLRPRPWV